MGTYITAGFHLENWAIMAISTLRGGQLKIVNVTS